MRRPLEGVRVLDLTRLLPGPFLTMVLADLGADVIKVEEPRVGDYMRLMPPLVDGLSARYRAINRGKRSLALELKSNTGRDALLRLARGADVVVESFRPGVLDRLGVGWDALRVVNPRLILCSLSGFGQDGPAASRAGHDLDFIALAGVLAMGGARGGPPALPGVQIADLGGGALWGVTAILAALFGRERTGEGEHLDISMTEGALALLAAEIGNLASGAPQASRGETVLNGAVASYGVYRCADGRYLAVAALEPKFWLAFNAAIGRAGDPAELLAPPDRQETIRREIEAIVARRSQAEWAAILADHDCCCEPVLELADLADHPLHRERGVFFAIDDGAGGSIPQVRTPLGRPTSSRPPPRLGEHSREILAEHGFSDAEIAAVLGR